MTKWLLTLFLGIYSWAALSQQEPLPHYPTRAEARQMDAFIDSLQALPPTRIPEPPPAPVRTMAEWEEVQAVAISWAQQYAEILIEIARHSAQECTVLIITSNSTSVEQQLLNAGVPLDNIELIDAPYNSVWIRDYGPWSVYHNDADSLMIVDWIYNRPWRPMDDLIPTVLAERFGLPIYEATQAPFDWIHTGGNNLRDGMGTNFSSELVLEENPGKTEAEIDAIAQAYLGASRYVKFPNLPYDLIHHIDMHMRFIDEETVIIGEYPEGVADGPRIEENLEYLVNEVPTSFGHTYNIIRIPMPPDADGHYPDNDGDYRTYTNAIFINKSILVPVYEERYDTTALRIYQEALPGYNVVGIDCNDIIPAYGAIHCITKLIGVNRPLWIAHPRLRNTYDTENDYQASAIIRHRSGIAGATLFYRIAPETAYTAVPMVLADSLEHTWTASIPAQSSDSEVQYYIHATAHSGKEQVRPLVAPEGYFRFRVDALRPAFTVTPAEICPGGQAQYLDQSEGTASSWQWFFPGGQPASSNEQNPVVAYSEAGSYAATLIIGNGQAFDTLSLEGVVSADQGAAPYFEGFEIPLEETPWAVDNPGSDGAQWAVSSQSLCYQNAMVMDNFNVDTRNTTDRFYSRFNLAGLSNPQLHFSLAYAAYDDQFADGLRVWAIPCNGEAALLYEAFGAQLASAPPTADAFVPADCRLWRDETLSLQAFAGQPITIAFENIGGYGNLLYIDNIDISAPELANQPPAITILSPADGAVFTGGLPGLEIRVAAEDSDGRVQKADFFINADSAGAALFPPFTFEYLATAYGTYQLHARATDNDGASTISSPVNITVEPANGVTVLPGRPGISFEPFPNPASGLLNIRFFSRQNAEVSIQLFNALGQRVHFSKVMLAAGATNHTIAAAHLPPGVYQLLAEHRGNFASQKVMVVN